MDNSSCRVCLTRASNKRLSVFNEVNDIPIVEKLQFVTGVVINQDDPFSKFLCFKCFTDTNTAYYMKTRCLDANRILKNQLKFQNQFQDFSVSDFNGAVKAEPIDAHLDPIVFIEPVSIKAELTDEWTETVENVNCLYLKLEDTREEITTKQITPKRKKANSSRKRSQPKGLAKHLQTAHDNVFQCRVCKINLPSLQSLTAHMKNGHEAKNIYKCTEINCDFSTKSEKQLSNHISRHLNVPKCKDCNASFSSIRKLLNHRKSEHPETFDKNEMPSKNKKLMPCDICGKLFRTKHMSDHKKSVHLKLSNFECDFCGKKFYFKKSGKSHLQKHIPKEFRSRPYECDICSQRFYMDCHLRLHIRLKHVTEDSEFPCYCGKTFKHQHYLEHHIKYVHQQMRPVCNICGKSYFDQSALRVHIKIAHTKNYQEKCMCNICGKTYYRQSLLNRHQKRVHGEKLFVCKYPDCNKKFSSRPQLDEHEKHSHLKIKSFICSEPNCNKSFIKRVSLVQHIRISHEKIRENCPVGNGCKFSVGRIDYMRRHLKTHSELSREELDKHFEIVKHMNLVS